MIYTLGNFIWVQTIEHVNTEIKEKWHFFIHRSHISFGSQVNLLHKSIKCMLIKTQTKLQTLLLHFEIFRYIRSLTLLTNFLKRGGTINPKRIPKKKRIPLIIANQTTLIRFNGLGTCIFNFTDNVTIFNNKFV